MQHTGLTARLLAGRPAPQKG